MPLSHYTVGDKGGTGKSTAVRVPIQYVRRHGADSLTSVQDCVRYFVFRNLKDEDYLPDYDESYGALSFRETFTPHHVVMPRLDEEYVTELERLDLTIAEVLDSSNGMSARGRNIGP